MDASSCLRHQLLAFFLLVTLAPRIFARDVPGQFGRVAGIGEWKWSYLDPTPDPDPTDGTPYPFKLGVADRDQRDKNGARFVPAIRYAHVAATFENSMIITHGYHYDMSPQGGGATWLSDTWSFDYDTHRWARLHDHIQHPLEGPVPRYAAVGVILGGDLYLHGGDDGGHAEGLSSYKHAIYGDLWRFILTPSASDSHPLHTWVRVRTAIEPRSFGRVPIVDVRLPHDDLYRCQHAGVIAPIGSKHTLWQIDTRGSRSLPGSNVVMPYLFVSHGLYAVEREKSSEPSNLSEDYDVLDSTDLWVFSFRTKLWRFVQTSAPPPGRFGHQIVYVSDAFDATQQTQPSGSLYLYGGFSRAGGNRGDLWMISLKNSGDTPYYPPFTWKEVHPSYADGAGLSPGSRGYFNFLWTPDQQLHLFAGARCEPGCVCSAEYWTFDLQQRKWTMLASSPHSPASKSYPARTASGAPHTELLTAADESVAVGYPVHRYKQSFVLRTPNVTDSGQLFEAFLFGGESYNPSAYYQDVWRFDYMPAIGRVTPAAVQSFAHLERLLHETNAAAFVSPLSSDRDLPPAPFHQHNPPNGWGAYRPRRHRAWSWPESRHSMQQPLEFLAHDSDADTTFWLIAVGTMLSVVAIGLGLVWCLVTRTDILISKAHRV